MNSNAINFKALNEALKFLYLTYALFYLKSIIKYKY